MDLIDDLSARGLIHDSTDLGFLRSRLDERSIGVYVGFDQYLDVLPRLEVGQPADGEAIVTGQAVAFAASNSIPLTMSNTRSMV